MLRISTPIPPTGPEWAARSEDFEKARENILVVPTLEEVFEDYMVAGERHAPQTAELYGYEMRHYLGD